MGLLSKAKCCNSVLSPHASESRFIGGNKRLFSLIWNSSKFPATHVLVLIPLISLFGWLRERWVKILMPGLSRNRFRTERWHCGSNDWWRGCGVLMLVSFTVSSLLSLSQLCHRTLISFASYTQCFEIGLYDSLKQMRNHLKYEKTKV